MHHKPIRLAFSILALAAAVAARPAAPQELDSTPRLRAQEVRSVPPAVMGSVAEAKGLTLGELPWQHDKACVVMTMSCNSTVTGELATDDCTLDDGTFIDFWEFEGTAGQTVTINLTSGDFDTFLFLLDPTPATVDFDDDGGTGTNSLIVFTLGSTGAWTIGANGFAPEDLGNYTLALECTGTGGPSPPAAPSRLTADPLSSTAVELAWRDNSDNEDEFRVEVRAPGDSFQDIGMVPANGTGIDVINLQLATTYDFRVRARNAEGDSAYSNVATATTFGDGGCIPSNTNLCLLGNRFKAEVTWRDFNDNTGVGRVVPLGSFTSPDSGLFYFFAPDNWEMLVKMVDACGSTFDTFWVFAAATTNVEYTLRVTDTESGAVRNYPNDLGVSSPAITDTLAFRCP